MHQYQPCPPCLLVALAACLMATGTLAYLPAVKEHFLTDALLREVVDRMGKDLADADDVYLDFPDTRMPMGRSAKDLELNEEQQQFPMDYETGNPNPSIRDQEYLQHSSLWSNQYNTGEGKQRIKPLAKIHNLKVMKPDAVLPAYCNPPNPCPVGDTSDVGCLRQFENTAAFSRDYQAAQDCMCDAEHMFDCPAKDVAAATGSDLSDSDIDRIIEQFQGGQQQHKNLVAKKFHVKKASNPYLEGEKLPVAAKKGNHVTAG